MLSVQYYSSEESIGKLEGKYEKHESLLIFAYYTVLVVLTVDPAWRSFPTTMEWPLEDAIISAVVSPCETVEGGMSY